jgi:hypothetical protein
MWRMRAHGLIVITTRFTTFSFSISFNGSRAWKAWSAWLCAVPGKIVIQDSGVSVHGCCVHAAMSCCSKKQASSTKALPLPACCPPGADDATHGDVQVRMSTRSACAAVKHRAQQGCVAAFLELIPFLVKLTACACHMRATARLVRSWCAAATKALTVAPCEQDYYGRVLSTSADLKTSACTASGRPHALIRRALADVPAEVLDKFYGCGAPVPLGIRGLRVLDLGCGSGRDCYVAAALGASAVTGVDMTRAQLTVRIPVPGGAGSPESFLNQTQARVCPRPEPAVLLAGQHNCQGGDRCHARGV